MESKTCTRCGQSKTLDLFKKNKYTKSGIGAECKQCTVDRVNKWTKNNTEIKKEYLREYNKTYIYKDISQRHKQYKAYKLRVKYNMTVDDLNKMIIDHNNQCDICGHEFSSDMTDRMNRVNIDHCHTTNKVRGLLCTRCNTMLGKVNDDVALLQSMINYINT